MSQEIEKSRKIENNKEEQEAPKKE